MVTHMHVGFKVEDYERWKEGYDASVEQRIAAGEISFQVFRNVDDPNTVTVLSVQESAEQIQAFIDSPDLQNHPRGAILSQELPPVTRHAAGGQAMEAGEVDHRDGGKLHQHLTE